MTRLEKNKFFKQFYEEAEKQFEEINASYKSHFELRNSYGFCVAPGSSIDGLDTTVVEVLFGSKPYRRTEKIIEMQIKTEVESAYGSKLCYHQIDNGDVFVFLHPAYTESHRAQENFIIIDHTRNSKKLLNKKFIFKHYKSMVSYLAVTSIENSPKLSDRIRILYLRTFKTYYSENTTYKPKFIVCLGKCIKQILIVGFSGILLAFLPLFINLNRNKYLEKKVETMIESQNKIIMLLDKINENSKHEDYSIYLEEIKNEIEKTNEKVQHENLILYLEEIKEVIKKMNENFKTDDEK